jgi:predicted aldo/keto reductase-like oxidoreductase
MKYRRFGRTNLQIPVFSCGGMRYQHKWNDVPPEEIPAENQKNLEATIHRSLELGINHIETARGYGTSEMQLGNVLPKLPREKLIVQTKVAPMTSAAEFLKTFDTSMNYLKLDHVELLSLHGINNAELLDFALRKGGCLDAARKLQKEGRCRFIGFSTHAGPQVVLDAVNSGEFDYVNLHWYFVNDANWGAIEAATRHDMGVFIISPNDKGGKLYEPSPKLKKLCEPLSPMIFNDLYCLARPQVHTLSLGASKPSDFDEHIKALEFYDTIPETIAPVEARLRAALADALGAEWAETWHQGLPEWEQVPGGINLYEIVRLWNYAKALDMVEFGKMRYNLLGNADHWFPGRNAAELRQHDLGPVLNGYRYRDRIPAILEESHALLFDEPKKRLSQSD